MIKNMFKLTKKSLGPDTQLTLKSVKYKLHLTLLNTI